MDQTPQGVLKKWAPVLIGYIGYEMDWVPTIGQGAPQRWQVLQPHSWGTSEGYLYPTKGMQAPHALGGMGFTGNPVPMPIAHACTLLSDSACTSHLG